MPRSTIAGRDKGIGGGLPPFLKGVVPQYCGTGGFFDGTAFPHPSRSRTRAYSKISSYTLLDLFILHIPATEKSPLTPL
ncbi:hypothetical protein A2Y83_03455 [Candidatus Falkowbacteria bacterium RBG_13_39_14]|uniref:Uncharacterized protein n=1 Tax=Candidatus Falkowbacteria bacterium RBG_13_39_14 TaxID=1797985 RepID=A0A1F5S109_9BACT|nr:MAG: hypothetical protein A2Y83_03455 [Candidatus Falkowbacteria bacterium RBG_13_39_14]